MANKISSLKHVQLADALRKYPSAEAATRLSEGDTRGA